ncbi:hypothetical protein [Streptomyces sp. SPB074]|uniref:hypothetical protein n=1 Tax=Streptomyces sp. (strain SPB074) TaxID=465543 RepID=UPI001F3D7991|nr:hypothetical protein [Streptomyces sp. SPB074]
MDAPPAAASLARLVAGPVAEGEGDPHGALVFGALLHLTRAEDAAGWWWRRAADGGSRTAAFLLFLLHSARGEFRDAERWRARGRHTPKPHPAEDRDTAEPFLPGNGDTPPPLSPTLRHRLLAQCHARRTPSLPAALESLMNRLPQVPAVDPEYGTPAGVPLPDASLRRLLDTNSSCREKT